ncbi:uncharacterized protein BYT42DRAFT_271939 [Radiomyces spectabilis]|uniref:uncharacterized protein n=1 Tax=Radiomyces spectabilis TaxID=64574 RepID=UPI002220B733|nr:uncharacterized protein BYT42DRAFT_271939 [Radiomyces spectabilis]KAI8384716.1 hypothetical protein BYT42DRAFT_271939 [Radiomyces spectabilis]
MKAAQEKLSQHPISVNDLETYCHNLRETASVSQELSHFYANTASNLSVYPLFRKLRLSAYFNQCRADSRLARTINLCFGWDQASIMGNWSAPNVKFHEPIRGVGMRRMLKKQGFEVYLLDEFKTSSCCPDCGDPLEKSRRCPIPGHTDDEAARSIMPWSVMFLISARSCLATERITKGRHFSRESGPKRKP